jgi:hypothetical protein
VLCNRFCGIGLGVGRISSCFLAAHMTDLAPLRRGFFCEFSLALCNHLSYCIGGVCRCSHSASPMDGRLSPAAAGLFRATSARGFCLATPTPSAGSLRMPVGCRLPSRRRPAGVFLAGRPSSPRLGITSLMKPRLPHCIEAELISALGKGTNLEVAAADQSRPSEPARSHGRAWGRAASGHLREANMGRDRFVQQLLSWEWRGVQLEVRSRAAGTSAARMGGR